MPSWLVIIVRIVIAPAWILANSMSQILQSAASRRDSVALVMDTLKASCSSTRYPDALHVQSILILR